ncbi:alginate export family protein [Sphingomonas sp. OTU376]|uniref:alginate export family protein n=1 Tax=Sphingomonas sp. OTU376 TaxID=3043863 RepID=UPI00313F3798
MAAPVPVPAHDAAPPALTVERYDEDWSFLADAQRRSGRWTEGFKYIPLNASGSVYLSSGIEVRTRYEGFRAPAWGAAPDTGYVWTRVMPYADLHLGGIRLFAQPIAAHVLGRSAPPSPIDRTGVDFLQAFGELELGVTEDVSLSLSAGRQLVSFGAGRLIDTRYGPNVPMAFDGIKARLDAPRMRIVAFQLRPVDTGPNDFDDRTSGRRVLWGAYGTFWSSPSRKIGTDLYYIGFRDRRAVFGQGAARELIHSFGARSFGQVGAMHWNVEGVLQTGSFGDAPVKAWGIGIELGRRFRSLPLRPDVSMLLDFASGDRNPGAKQLQTFNPLFPRGKYFGALSPIGPRNFIHLHHSAAFDAGRGLTLTLGASAFWRQSAHDGIYTISGDVVRRGGIGGDRFIGHEFEMAASWQMTPELNLSASVSAFAPGAFIKATGPARTTLMSASTISFRF